MVLHGTVLYCMRSWLRRAGCVSQDAYILHKELQKDNFNQIYWCHRPGCFVTHTHKGCWFNGLITVDNWALIGRWEKFGIGNHLAQEPTGNNHSLAPCEHMWPQVGTTLHERLSHNTEKNTRLGSYRIIETCMEIIWPNPLLISSYMLNCKINSKNGGTFSKSAGKIFGCFFLVQGA